MWKAILNPKIGFWRDEITNKKKDGSFINVLLSITTLFDNDNKPEYFLAHHIDITKKKETEIALKLNDEKLRVIFEKSPDCIKWMDLKGKIFYMNPAGIEEHRLDPQNFKETYIHNIIHKDNLPEFNKAFKQAKKGNIVNIEIKHSSDTSNRHWCLLTLSPLKNESGKIESVFGFSRDIGSLKETEKSLRESKERWRSLVKNAPNLILILNPDHTIEFINHSRFGPKGKISIGMSIYNLIDEEYHDKAKIVHNQVFATGTPGKYEAKINIPGNGTCWLEMHVGQIKYENKIKSIVLIGTDVTERRRIEKAKTEFLSIASHQLRTPPTAVKWFTNMLLEEDVGKINNKQRSYLQEVIYNNQRMIDLVHSLLNVSKIDMGTFSIEPKSTNLIKIINSILKELRPQIEKRKIKININYSKKFPKIFTDPALVRVIFQNLIFNSIKYSFDEGEIKIDIKI